MLPWKTVPYESVSKCGTPKCKGWSIIHVNLPFWSAHRYSPGFINMFQWIDLKGTCPGTPDVWLVKPTRFSQGRSMHISLRQGEHRQSVVTGPYWPSNRKTLQNICKISARQHWYWHHAILYELLWALICGHTAKHRVSKLVHSSLSSKIWRFQENSTMHRSLQEMCYSPGLAM